MEYIAHKRFKRNGIDGEFNIPAQTVCDAVDNCIVYNGRAVCFVSSAVAHKHFAVNTDGRGMERGRLTGAIAKCLEKNDSKHQARWDLVWGDPLCNEYRRQEYDDYWLWSHEFYNAPIVDLRYIAKLIGAKEENK